MMPLRRRWVRGALALLSVLLAAVPVASTGQAQGWTQERGSGYYKIGFRTFRTSQYYTPGGARVEIPTVGDYTLSFYGEHGVTEWLTAMAYVPFERITLNRQVGRRSGSVFAEGDAVTGLADPIVGVRLGLARFRSTVVSAGLKLGLPSGNSDQPNGLLTGDGEWNQLLTLEIGHSFAPVPAYASASAGFNQRTGDFSDEFVYGLEAGYTVAGAWTFSGRIDGVESLGNGNPLAGGQRGFNGGDQRYLAFGGAVTYTRNDAYGATLGAESLTRGQNVLSAVAFSAGVFLKR